jgi:DmsE family decaheme c-type cytochrome
MRYIHLNSTLPLAFAALALLLAGAPSNAMEARTGIDAIDRCTKCHDETESHPVLSILKTRHGRIGDSRTPLASDGCSSCHGPSDAHARSEPGRVADMPTVSFGPEHPSPVADQNEPCLGCHKGGLRMNWAGSMHQNQDVACVSCHEIHARHDPVLAKRSQPEVCFDCHKTQRAQLVRNSHHPVLEGELACSDCHNPHGSVGPKLLKEVTLNETCYGCHAEKRGPFLWEHVPVREDCTNCHTPHGSNHDRLLKVKMPWLCQQCHSAQFHPSNVYSGTGIPPAGAAQQLIEKSCINCHSQIHGTNHPAGVRKTR